MSVTPVLAALVVLDLADGSIRRWFAAHALTTSALTGVLVLLITVLIVDRVVHGRQIRERGQVTAAQAGLLARQAQRASELVRAALSDPQQRDPASEEVRTYMTMLLLSAPVLIDARAARAFLEEAQRLGGLLNLALRASADARSGAGLDDQVAAAADRVRAAAQPLVSILDTAQLTAVHGAGGDDP